MRFLLSIIACLIAAYGLAAYMAIPANPEIQFWRTVDQLRDKDIAEVRQAMPGQPILFFTGGSSCAFSIDPKIVEETCGMPAFNLGLPVSAGAKFLLHQALEKCRKGDILVVCLEPDALTYPDEFKASTFSLGLASLGGNPSGAVGGTSFGNHLSLRESLNLSRPGPGYLTTWLAKTASGKGYRYQARDIRYHGRLETAVSDPALPLAAEKFVTELHPDGRTLLTTFKAAAERKEVRLLYSMPWILTAQDSAAHNRAANLKILSSIQPLIPTIDDGHQAVATDPALFSDSGLHLSAKGSALRSQALANALRAKLDVGL